MTKFKTLAFALMAVCAFGALSASAAYAEHNPVWLVGTKILPDNETKEILATAKSSQILFSKTIAGNVLLLCKEVKLSTGAVIFNGGTPLMGESKETFKYSECHVNEPSGCEIVDSTGKKTAEITTNPLHDLLAWREAAGTKTVTVFRPETGAVFVKIILAKCANSFLNKETSVEGEVLSENVSPGFNEMAVRGITAAPGNDAGCTPKGSPITKYFVFESGKRVEKTIKKLLFFGGESEYCGEGYVDLVSQESWGITEA